jgi:hypothetical protein
LNKNKSSLRESRIVDFPEFRGGDQDPIEWFDEFERAYAANNINKKRKFQIAKVYLKGEAQTWVKKSGIREWYSLNNPNVSFKHQYKAKYCGTFTKTIWRQKLRNLRQKYGETVESYYAKLVELWH